MNPQQRRAITVSDGPVLVLAGPGSGKTRVLTRRVAWLVLQGDVAPWRIMAVTFTNKAAREMRERLEQLLGASRARPVTMGTFHATCARILRMEAEAAGIAPEYVIFDSDDQRRLVKQALQDLGLDEKQYRPRSIHTAISRAKNELVPPANYQSDTYYGEIVKRVYERYQNLLRLNNALDFDDLLMVTVRMFAQNPDVLATYQDRYLHILVDEFQDTNQAQYLLLRQLSGGPASLFCVADEDQSIYAWRGADYRNIRRLRQDHPDLLTVLLEQNYRSTQTILDAARAVIRQNPDRTDKRLFTERGRGPRVNVWEAYDADQEGQMIVDTIAQMVAQGDAEPGDCAVMYRTNAQSRALEDAFMRAGLPYKLVGATRFYARREVKDLVAFLRVIHNPADGVSLTRVINLPPRGIGRKTLGALETHARQQGLPLFEALIDTPSSLGTRACNALERFREMLMAWVEARQQLTVAELIDRVIEDTGFGDYLRDGSDEGEDRWANVLELRSVAADFEDIPLTDFLAEVALVSDVDNLSAEANAPTLLTLHAAKGLEFPVVFIAGLEEGLLPHSRSLEEPEQLAEERRLLYVGMTRAKDRLFLSYAFMRMRYGDTEPSVPSSFLQDIPQELIEGAHPFQGRRVSLQTSSAGERGAASEGVSQGPQFRAGQTVRHSAFGEGLVIESRQDGADQIVSVVFADVGLKRLLADVAPLEIVDG